LSLSPTPICGLGNVTKSATNPDCHASIRSQPREI
jgi:hypothetical protein